MAMHIWSRSYALFDTSEGVGTRAACTVFQHQPF
jgi:hypothetical protein